MKSLFLMLALVALPVGASDVSGKWSGTFEAVTNDGNTKSEPLLLIFKQDGDKLTGSGGPNEGERHEMKDGKVVGDKITFEVPLERGSILFALTVEGDQIKGDMKRVREGGEQTAKVTLKRLGEK
jgi:hypothetical protein